MKNREKYADKIIDISASSKLGLLDGKPVPCMSTRCSQCQFHNPDNNCAVMASKWLDSEYVAPPIDWSKVPVDTKILVRDHNVEPWQPRYFARFEYGKVYAWNNGGTSYTEKRITVWAQAKLFEEEKANE